MQKKLLGVILSALMVLLPQTVQAHGHGRGQDEFPSLKEKYFDKLFFLMEHRDQLGLNEQQVQSILDKKMDVKKAAIEAEFQNHLAMIDLHRELHADKPDVEKMKTLVDTQADAQRNLGKTLVDALVFTKNVLNAEQQAKAKQIYLNEKFPQVEPPGAPEPAGRVS